MKIQMIDRDMHIFADNQNWTLKDVETLEKDFNVYYNLGGVMAIRKIERNKHNPLLQIGIEDDGHIAFRENRSVSFDAFWAQDLIKVLNRAINSDSKQ